MKPPTKFFGPLALLLGGIVLSVPGCRDREPIRIGYIGGLTGRTADLGISGRDGIQLAVEEINASGGIQGRPVELLVRDDRQEPDDAAGAVEDLAAAGVSAIVGPMTSDMALAALPRANANKKVLISPTVSTDRLSNLDDYFLRVYPISALAAEPLSEFARRRLGLKRVLIVFDEGNRSHTEPWREAFARSFGERNGGVTAVSFRSGQGTSLLDLAQRLAKIEADGLLILANAMDSALICQQLKKLGDDRPVMTNEWAATDDLIAFGGKAVEGIFFFQTFDRDCRLARYQAFRRRFLERFRTEPRFASVHAYDATRLLFAALARNSDPSRMRETLLALPPQRGLQVELSFTPEGDIRRPLFLTTIRDGCFVSLEPR